MHRRRMGLAVGLLFFGVLIAVKPPLGELRLSIDPASGGEGARVEAAFELGAFAISILMDNVAQNAR